RGAAKPPLFARRVAAGDSVEGLAMATKTADEQVPDERRIRIADLILRLRRVGITDQRVLGAIESVPRDLFVPAESRAEAYAERALPIDCGQTISAPVIVGI